MFNIIKKFNLIDWFLVVLFLVCLTFLSFLLIFPKPWNKYYSDNVNISLSVKNVEEPLAKSLMESNESYVAGINKKFPIKSKEKRETNTGTYEIIYSFEGKGLKEKNLFEGQQLYVGQKVRIKNNFLTEGEVISFE